ncbi:hypothetical protein HUJ05_002152 [Dendroctonus ponderosae]|nr:hypothetical protein HUJ05_002152 [Dendroctonus ponderosae]
MGPFKIDIMLCVLALYISRAATSQHPPAEMPPLLIVKDDNVDNLIGSKASANQFLVEKSDQDPHDPDLGPDQDPIQLCQIHLNRAQLQNKYGT